MKTVASELLQIIETSSSRLSRLSEEEASVRPAKDKWSKKQLLGHLIDSATNNHHRFVRAQQVESFTFPRYEQEHWVDAQGYDSTSWTELIEFWRLYNRHLARIIENIPQEKLAVMCTIGPYEPVTLGFLAEDYLLHLKHHLNQIGAL